MVVECFSWQVVSINGDVQYGVADTFKEAIEALAAWYGDGCPDRGAAYHITPIVIERK